MTQQQTERDKALIEKTLIEEAERLTNAAYGNVKNEDWYYQCYQNLVRLLRGDEPAKPDRYMQAWEDAYVAWDDKGSQAAAAVLRKHFPSVEVPVDVLMAARRTRYILGQCDLLDAAHTMADFILKGDQ